MDQARRNELFYRIVTGEINIRIGQTAYKLTPPSISVKSEAEEIYRSCLEENLFADWLTEQQCLAVLVNMKLVAPTIDKDIEEAEKNVETAKITLYDSFTRNFRIEDARKALENVRNHYNKLFNMRHHFDYLTAQHFAETERRRHILINTLHYTHGGRVWQNLSDVDVFLLDKISNKLYMSHPTMEEIRFLSRNDPWRSCWNIDKERIFNRSSFELNDEQKIIVNFSQRYDNAYQHPECPSDAVFEDDDLFDGWQLTQIRKHEKDKKTSEMEARMPGKIKSAGEVYILARDEQDAKHINSLNTVDAEIAKQKRMNTLKQKGVVKEVEMPDSKQAIQQKQREALKQRN